TPCEASIRVLRYDKYSMDDLQSLAKDLEGKLKKLLVLVSEREISALLLSDGKPDAGKLVKENAAIYKGKGGGNPKLARAIFDDPENLELYLDLIEKHLR
ncbi:MAG TPA: DHHA1 domain-containing protein, partial [Bacillota bacterium]|nr:DHHA1 domain-containing protein [Bacillota bacterium]